MKVTTFYSYKGGLGRSLLLATCARRLAAAGKSVLAVDLDLEAPGLLFKLGFDRRSPVGDGVVGLLRRFCSGEAPPGSLRDWVRVVPGQERLQLLPAGPTNVADYWRDLASVEWDSLFRGADPQGVRFFTWLREAIERDLAPDHLLVDARTGITAMGGAAVSLLADQVIALVGTSPESQHGAREVLRAITVAPRLADRTPVRLGVVLARLPGTLLAEEVQTFRQTVRSFLIEEAAPLRATLSVEFPMVIRSEPALERDERAAVDANGLQVLGDYDVVAAWLQDQPEPETVAGRFLSGSASIGAIEDQVRQLREMAERAPVSQIPVLAASLRNLSRSLAEVGRNEDAMRVAQEAVSLYRRLATQRSGSLGAELAVSLHGLANVLVSQGRYGDAEQAYREVLQIEEVAFGSRRTPNSIPTLVEVASLLLRQNQAAEAEGLARDAWQGSLEHGDLINAVRSGPVLVSVLATLERHDEARAVGGTVVELLQKLPADHPVRIAVSKQIGLDPSVPPDPLAEAVDLARGGRFAEAAAAANKVAQSATVAGNHGQAAIAHFVLAQICQANGDHAGAIREGQRAVALARQAGHSEGSAAIQLWLAGIGGGAEASNTT